MSMHSTTDVSATLVVTCRDRPGVVATLSNFVYLNGGNILDVDHHSEAQDGGLFMRLVWSLAGFQLDRAGIATQLDRLGSELGIRWRITYSDARPRVAVFVSKTPHCLYDLLLRQQLGELGGDIVLVVSNHAFLRPVAAHFGVDFHCLSTEGAKREEVEAQQLELLDRQRIDVVVLARYMQILSPGFVERWPGKIINIHHSFLPAFVGAKPYHQAKERGVKIIGATAHYVTSELDQGPIIVQDVAAITHRHDVEEMIRRGRDLERQVLSHAVRLHLEHRVLITGNRTIVFA
jgi:formyltetrahydrofolate deformylase